MPLYTLYPCKADGSSDTFVTFDLSGDDEAYFRALHVLDQHETASHVAIWCGERKVSVFDREHDVLKASKAEGNAPSLGNLWPAR